VNSRVGALDIVAGVTVPRGFDLGARGHMFPSRHHRALLEAVLG
jgi:hypothetical protein